MVSPSMLVGLLAGVAATAASQDTSPRRPRLLEVGALPSGAPIVVISADGGFARPDGRAFDPVARPPAGESWPTVVVRASHRCEARHVGSLVDGLAARGCLRIVFEVERRVDGAVGGFELRLGDHAELAARAAPVTVEMHRRRPGVPSASLQPPLRWLARAVDRDEVTVGVLAPGDAPLGAVLDVPVV